MRGGIVVSWVAVGVMALVAGCAKEDGGGSSTSGAVLDEMTPAAIGDTAGLLAFASGSAPNMFALGALPYGAVEFSQDTACPERVVDGNTTTLTGGGCTDTSGNTYDGVMIVRESGAQAGSIEYQGFSIANATSCGGTGYSTVFEYDGSFSGGAPGTFAVDVLIAIDGIDEDTCAPAVGVTAAEYQGSVADNGDADTYAGHGRLGFDFTSGNVSYEGVADVSTAAEVTDDNVCSTEALSGTTTIEADGHTSVITYDGATDCDPDGTVTWTYDGADQGEIFGVSCRVHPAGTGRGALLGSLVLGALGILVVRRREMR